jgi:excisionase family DNA binding protein
MWVKRPLLCTSVKGRCWPPVARATTESRRNGRKRDARGASVTPEDLLALPPALDIATAAEILGVGRSSAYELIRRGDWPTPVLRLGRLIRVPKAPLLDLLGVHEQAS